MMSSADGISFWSDMMATLDISKTPLANVFRNEGPKEGRIESRRETPMELG